MRIGIFGGSFNPPHKMHEEMALYFIDNKILDKVIFVPTGNKYMYKTDMESDIDRYNMVKIITDKYAAFEVSDYEFKERTVYTYQTLNYFKECYPHDEIYFICGLDNLSYIDKWERGTYILSNYKILVIKRNTDDLAKVLEKFYQYRDNIIVIDMECKDISSTMIRKEIAQNIYDENLDDEVIKYIKEKGLYRG